MRVLIRMVEREKRMKAKFSSYLTLASSAALAQGLLLLISPLVTRLYGPEDVGGFAVVLGFGALTASIGTGRLEHAVPIARNSSEAIRIALLGLVLVMLTSTVMVLLVCLTPLLAPIDSQIWQTFPLAAIPAIAFSLALFQVVNALLLRQRAYRSVGVNKICQGGITGLAQLWLGWAAFGATGLIWAQACGYLAGGMAGMRRLLIRSVVVLRRRGLQARETLWHYRKFPLVLAPAALFNLAAQHLPVFALGYVYGLYEAGLYALVMRICGAPLGLVGQAVAQVYASEFRVYRANNDGKLASKYMLLLLRLFAIGIIAVGFLVLVMNLWGTELFGAKWANIGAVTSLLSLMLLMDFATTPASMTLGYLGQERIQLLWDIGRLLAVAGVFVAVPLFSLRFGQVLVLLAGVWSVCLLIHAGLTYRACRQVA